MADVDELMGTPEEIRLNGQTYTLTPLQVSDYGLIAKHIKSERGDPIEIARRLAESATPEERKMLFDKAFETAYRARHVTAEELDEWINTPAGFAYCLWLMLRPKHPDVGLEQAAELLVALGEQEMARIWEAGSGMPLGNFPSPTQAGNDQTNQFPGDSGSES